MLVDEKHTSRDNFSSGHFLHSGIMHVPWTCPCVCLPLIVLIQIAILLGVGAFLGPMPHLVAVKTGLITPKSYGAPLTAISFWYGNSECLTERFLWPAVLSFRWWRPELRCRWAELWPSCDRSSGL